MKLAAGNFCGFPEFSKFVQEKLQTVPLLNTFQTIEQCSLEYDPSVGASIDPHIDDCWIWGERVVTVNCLSDSVLTLSLLVINMLLWYLCYKKNNYFRYNGDRKRYNLQLVDEYKSALMSDLEDDGQLKEKFSNIVIRVPMPRRSLIILYGSARYQWEHSVLREDILSRRVCIAYREFTQPYLEAASERGSYVLSQAKLFWDHLSEPIAA